ncbi:RCC1 domain-containing protein, partial [Rhodococcus qingshengii]|uniref:RCC1 domain-containing protein n=1 Tax=Rhodococcus qingshengii TaxID=334542 RepID=UPI0022BDB383|nr:serine/threonine protein kinase [Rhodococcus qingshengii]
MPTNLPESSPSRRRLPVILIAILTIVFGLTTVQGVGAPSTADPVVPTSTSGATALSAGDSHSCAMVVGGTVKCWGSNWWGQLGDGTTRTDRLTPVDVVGVPGATAVSAGWVHSCAVVAGGTVKCWGTNWDGALGDGTTTNRLTPVDVVGVSGATALSA